MFILTTKYHFFIFWIPCLCTYQCYPGRGGKVGILIASVVLGMHLLTQNGWPWGIKYDKCMAILSDFDKTCPWDMFCQNTNPYYLILRSAGIIFCLTICAIHALFFMAIRVARYFFDWKGFAGIFSHTTPPPPPPPSKVKWSGPK